MPMTYEKTISVDSGLAKRVDRKMRRYGLRLDDALSAALTYIVTTRGLPSFVSPVTQENKGDLVFADVEDAISYLHAHA